MMSLHTLHTMHKDDMVTESLFVLHSVTSIVHFRSCNVGESQEYLMMYIVGIKQ